MLDHLGPFRTLWDHLGPFGTIWNHLEPFGLFGPFGPFETIWENWGSFGTCRDYRISISVPPPLRGLQVEDEWEEGVERVEREYHLKF